MCKPSGPSDRDVHGAIPRGNARAAYDRDVSFEQVERADATDATVRYMNRDRRREFSDKKAYLVSKYIVTIMSERSVGPTSEMISNFC
jgi:hypothetical protein